MAAQVLDALIDDGYDIATVVTRPDVRRGRGSSSSPSPVKVVADRHGIRVVHDLDGLLEEHRRSPIELGVVVAYGAIIKAPVLAEIPMVNIHVSLLPRWRGAAPVERAILAGDRVTGVCLMQVERGLDTGGVIASTSLPIVDSTTAEDIRNELIGRGTQLLLDALHSGRFATSPQVGEPTYAAKIDPAERKLDWGESTSMVSRRVRIGGAWTVFRGRRLKVDEVEITADRMSPGTVSADERGLLVGCADGAVRILEVQPEGRSRIPAADWIRGARIQSGETMGDV